MMAKKQKQFGEVNSILGTVKRYLGLSQNKPAEGVREPDWTDVGPGGGARRILDTAEALKKATPKKPK